MLKISNFTKRFGDKIAVDNLCLEIKSGEICGFIGHNGAGKTTTIKAVCGILDFSDGDILLGGVSIRSNPIECKKTLAYIPDNPDLYEYLTGIQYLNFIADVFAIDKQERMRTISELADKLGLTDELAEPVSSYSHGMKQKLAIIAAWLHNPKLIVMDEPFVGLDPKASHVLKTLMREFCKKGGAIFFSTHVLEVAEKLCDKVAIIKNGKLITQGTMSEIKGDGSLENVFFELEGNETKGGENA
ncbi:MAG: ABC transporter ATP-binding protein [Christensenellaceae bacterium]